MNERAIFLLIIGGKPAFDWIRLLDHQGYIIIETDTRVGNWRNYSQYEVLAKNE